MLGLLLRSMVASGAFVLSACPDPGADFDAFARRAGTEAREPDSSLSCETPEGELPEPDQLSGTFLFVVSTTLGPDTPFVYLLDVDAAREGLTYQITMTAQPLAADDRSTPVGDAAEPQTFMVEANGCFSSPPTTFEIPAKANPILPVVATSELSFAGSVVSAIRDSAGKVTFWCGQVNGRSITPLPMNIDGSTFAAIRVTDADHLPDAVINCEMTPARAL